MNTNGCRDPLCNDNNNKKKKKETKINNITNTTTTPINNNNIACTSCSAVAVIQELTHTQRLRHVELTLGLGKKHGDITGETEEISKHRGETRMDMQTQHGVGLAQCFERATA